MCDKCEHNNGFVKGALLGALIGGVLSLLYAPKSGEETRKHLKKKGHEMIKMGKDAVEDFNEQLENKLDEIIEQVEDAATPIKERAIEKLEMLADELEDKKALTKKVTKRLFKNTNLS